MQKILTFIVAITMAQSALAQFKLPSGPMSLLNIDCELSQADLDTLLNQTNDTLRRSMVVAARRGKIFSETDIKNFRLVIGSVFTSNLIIEKCPSISEEDLPFEYSIWETD